MNDLDDFYMKILNIKSINGKDIIRKVVEEKKSFLREKNIELTGLCKFMASIIEDELKNKGIRTYYLDFNELINIDHVVLIAEYRENNNLKRILIDPTFEQFVRKDESMLCRLGKWPSDKIKNKQIVSKLCSEGIFEIDDESFSDYLSSFSTYNIEVNLDELLLNMRLDNISKRK